MNRLLLHVAEPIPGLNAIIRAAGAPHRGVLAGLKQGIQKSVAEAALESLGDAEEPEWASLPIKEIKKRTRAFADEKRGKRSAAVKEILETVKRAKSADDEAREKKRKSKSLIKPEERPVVIFTSYRPRPLEIDDYIGGGKFHLDAIRYLGLIMDDKVEAAVIQYSPQIQVHRDHAFTRIEISTIDEAGACDQCGSVMPIQPL